MLAHLLNTLRYVLVVTFALALTVVFVPDASATTADGSSCAVEQAGDDDFFPSGEEIITVISSSTDPASRQAAANVVQQLNEFYEDTDMRISTEEGEPTTHAIVVDGDVAVPGQPRSFVVASVDTLYLHWTTAATDLAHRLESTPRPSCESTDDSGTQAASVLAYTDEPATEVEAPAITSTPIANQSPSTMWHLPALAAGALACSAGGVRRGLAQRRDQKNSESGVNPSEPGAAIANDKPRYPIADLPPMADRPHVVAAPTYPVADLPPTN